MVGEVRLARSEETGIVVLEFVVDPQPAHRVVTGRVDTHRHLVRVLSRDPLVHVEQVSVALLDDVDSETIDGIGEVEIHAVFQRADTLAGIDGALGGA